MESIIGSDSCSDYVESDETSLTSPANTQDLAVHTSKLEEMHEVAEEELDAIAQPTVFFSQTDELGITELADSDTDPPENHQNNGAMPPVNTQPSMLHLPP